MTDSEELHFDVDEIADIFGPPTGTSDPDRGVYWFTYEGNPERSVTLTLSVHRKRASIIVRMNETVTSASIEGTTTVRVLEAGRKTLELVSPESQTRIFVSLDGESVFEVAIGSTEAH